MLYYSNHLTYYHSLISMKFNIGHLSIDDQQRTHYREILWNPQGDSEWRLCSIYLGRKAQNNRSCDLHHSITTFIVSLGFSMIHSDGRKSWMTVPHMKTRNALNKVLNGCLKHLKSSANISPERRETDRQSCPLVVRCMEVWVFHWQLLSVSPISLLSPYIHLLEQ